MRLKTNTLITALLLAVFTFAFVGCSQLEDDSQPNLDNDLELFDIPTTIDRIQNGLTENYAPNARANSKNTFSTFNAALGASGLASVFSRNDLTAFAPTDAAFAELGLNPGNIRRLPNLTEILLYHVVGGTVLSTDLSNTFAQTVNGQFIEINADNLTINGANIVAADIRARNGVIHAIDAVLLPPSKNLLEVALELPNYSILAEAVASLGLAETLATIEDVTVFAPNNQAFLDLLEVTGYESLGDLVVGLTPEVVTDIILYHIVPARVFSTELVEGEVPTAFEGNVLEISLSDGPAIVDQTGGISNIEVVNVQATNGVIHGIDRVLLPFAP